MRGNLEGVFQATAQAGLDSYLESLTDEERSSQLLDRTLVPRLQVDSGKRGLYDPNPGSARQARILGGVVVLLLLIVCANIANLLVSRGTARHKELVIRQSVGASRRRLVRQLVTEGVVLSAIGGGLGVLVAYAARQILPFGGRSPFDWRVFAFVAALSLAVGILFSLVPALRATRVDLSVSLNASGRTMARSRSLLSKALLVGQVAVSLVLLVGAALFLKTLENLRTVDVGFNPANILLFVLAPDMNGYEEEQTANIYERVAESVRSLPGVRSVSLTEFPLLSGATSRSNVHLEGSAAADDHGTHLMTVSREFFETMEIPLLAGRVFDDRDHKDAPQTVLINGAAAHEWYGGENPLGRRLGFSPESSGEFEIVGLGAF